MKGEGNRRLLSRGFTLVELLVALTIMAMVAGILANSMSFGLGTTEKVEASIDHSESLQQVQRAVRRLVQQARPVIVNPGIEPQVLEFQATSRQLDFVAPLPGIGSGGLLYHVSLQFDDADPDSHRLVMRYMPYLPGVQRQGVDQQIHEYLLLDGFSFANFSYLDALNRNGEDWADEWRNPGRLPDLVRLSIGFGNEGVSDPVDVIVSIRSPFPNSPGVL